jgi:hypothetical protein
LNHIARESIQKNGQKDASPRSPSHKVGFEY